MKTGLSRLDWTPTFPVRFETSQTLGRKTSLLVSPQGLHRQSCWLKSVNSIQDTSSSKSERSLVPWNCLKGPLYDYSWRPLLFLNQIMDQALAKKPLHSAPCIWLAGHVSWYTFVSQGWSLNVFTCSSKGLEWLHNKSILFTQGSALTAQEAPVSLCESLPSLHRHPGEGLDVHGWPQHISPSVVQVGPQQ